MSVLIFKKLWFKEFIDREGNRVEKLPCYLESLFRDEYSPIKSYMQTIEPDCEITVSIIVETFQKRK